MRKNPVGIFLHYFPIVLYEEGAGYGKTFAILSDNLRCSFFGGESIVDRMEIESLELSSLCPLVLFCHPKTLFLSFVRFQRIPCKRHNTPLTNGFKLFIPLWHFFSSQFSKSFSSFFFSFFFWINLRKTSSSFASPKTLRTKDISN